ncbi:hypothetical protein SDC9_207832 [bioreactor metagenome]|uniref:Uncharacterized protein n=1 Tax=bioreactor metagenome TaxID=1076179 RepID=A0A645J9M7_9ZZZZ
MNSPQVIELDLGIIHVFIFTQISQFNSRFGIVENHFAVT